MPRSSTARWLLACAGSALLLCAVVLTLMTSVGPPGPPPPPGPEAACEVPPPTLPRAWADAEGPPVILWAVGGARLFVDGRAAFSPPESPRHFTAGLHTLRVEAEGHPPVESRFRLDPWQPALFHAEVDPAAGIVVLGLGGLCETCEPPITDLRIGHSPSTRAASTLLQEAAAALRGDDWQAAAAVLSELPPAARTRPLARRLLAGTLLRALQPDAARAQLKGLRGAAAGDLPVLLARLDALEASERIRREEVMLQRWNRLTEQHAALVRQAAGRGEEGLGDAAARLASASERFSAARTSGDRLGSTRALADAELGVQALLDRLAAGACENRSRALGALGGVEGP